MCSISASRTVETPDRDGLESIADIVETIAEAEGLAGTFEI